MGGYVETPGYTVVKTGPGFELRQYVSMVVAETEVQASRSGNGGFRKLAGYIFGGNEREQSISMTAPVVQQEVERDGQRRWVMTFMMPSQHPLDSLPRPRDSSVRLRQVPAALMAVQTFSGSWDQDDVMKRVEQLKSRLSAQGIKVAGNPLFARYDPPWTPPFLRRNEVLLPVEPTEVR